MSEIEWDAAGTIGAIDNSQILLGALTVASLAVFLPASRASGEIFFESVVGAFAFGGTLMGLILTVIATAFSTRVSFILLVTSLITAATLGSWGTFRQVKARKAQEAGEGFMVARRASLGAERNSVLAANCTAVIAAGRRCANRRVVGQLCRTHARTVPKVKGQTRAA